MGARDMAPTAVILTITANPGAKNTPMCPNAPVWLPAMTDCSSPATPQKSPQIPRLVGAGTDSGLACLLLRTRHPASFKQIAKMCRKTGDAGGQPGSGYIVFRASNSNGQRRSKIRQHVAGARISVGWLQGTSLPSFAISSVRRGL